MYDTKNYCLWKFGSFLRNIDINWAYIEDDLFKKKASDKDVLGQLLQLVIVEMTNFTMSKLKNLLEDFIKSLS